VERSAARSAMSDSAKYVHERSSLSERMLTLSHAAAVLTISTDETSNPTVLETSSTAKC